MFGRNNYRDGGAADDRPVCKFFLEGRCKFGASCKNYHPQNQNGGAGSVNRFAPLQNGANNNFRGRTFGGNDRLNQNSSNEQTFGVTVENIKADLTIERPIWPLSSYAPGLNAPRQLMEGDLEQSFEEARLLCYVAQAQGNPQEYVQKEQAMLAQSNQQVQTVLSDLNGARKYILDAQFEHPNRNDQTIQPQIDFPRSNMPAQVAQSSGLGQPSAFGAPANGGGISAFGQPSAPGSRATAFGAPSALGAASGFGKPSPLGGGATFGQASNPGQASAFGQPSRPSGFGAPSALGPPKPAFGQPTGLATQQSPSGGMTSFGQPSQPSPFGAPKSSATGTGFGQASAFGQPSGFGVNTKQSSPFAQAAQNQQAQTASPFGTGQAIQSPFGGREASANGFGPQAAPSPFGSRNTTSPFGQTQPHAATNGLSMPGLGSRPSAFGNKQVLRNEDGTAYHLVQDPKNPLKQRKNRIWMPDGPPLAANPDAEGPSEAYEGEKGARLKEEYESAMNNNTFVAGSMPEVPPKRDWIDWDL